MITNARPYVEPPRVLLVEPEADLSNWLIRALRRAAFDVTASPVLCGPKRFYRESDVAGPLSRFDLVMVNAEILDQDSIEFISRLQQRGVYPPLVIVDERAGSRPQTYRRLDVAAIIDKPLAIRRYIPLLRQLLPVS